MYRPHERGAVIWLTAGRDALLQRIPYDLDEWCYH